MKTEYFKSHFNQQNMIHHLTPYNLHGNIGKGINDAVAEVSSPCDWICLRDGDTMFLRADWGKRIDATINKFGDEYGLMSCFTNRLNPNSMQHQLHGGVCSNETYIDKHIEIYDTYPKEPEMNFVPNGKVVAGFFMLFQKKLWLNLGGFVENTLHFDSDFTMRAQQKGVKVGVMTNLYVFHIYRIWDKSNSVQANTKHLV